MTQAANNTPDQLRKIGDFLDRVIEKMGLKNDAALSRALGVAPPVISKTRSGILPFGILLMTRIHDASGIALAEIRAALGVPPLVPRYGTL